MKNKYLTMLLREIKESRKEIYLENIIYSLSFIIFNLTNIYILKIVVDLLAYKPRLNEFLILIGLYLLITSCFGYLMQYIQFKSYSKISDFRMGKFVEITDKLNFVDYQLIEDPVFQGEAEAAMTAISNNNEGMEGLIHVLYQMGPLVLLGVFYSVYLAKLNFLIPLLILVSNLILYVIEKKANDIFLESQNKRSQYRRQVSKLRNISYDFSYGKDVRVYGMADMITGELDKRFKTYIGLVKDYRYRGLGLSVIGMFALIVSDFTSFYILLRSYLAGGLLESEFIMLISLIISFNFILGQVQKNISIYYNNRNYLKAYYDFVNKDHGDARKKLTIDKEGKASIRFDQVSFKYPKSDSYVLEDLTFTIEAGEKVGIVGTNGAGKTTLIKLMTGLLDPSKGDIYINDINIKNYGKKDLFNLFNVVFQKVNVYAFSVLENVAMDYENIDEKRAWEALEEVGLREKIESLPKGGDQVLLKAIDENGTELSGGESQKLSIARAIYKGGQAMVLDEPTSALDAINEALIYENYNQLVRDKTAIFISHRLASTKFTDRIILIDDKKIAEEGNHEELMAAQGKYYEMFMVQSKYYREEK